MMDTWTKVATNEQIEKTAQALEKNGINVIVVENAEAAKKTVLSMVPKGAEVMTMTSETLKETGIEAEISTSREYNAVHPKLLTMDRSTQDKEMKKLRSVNDYAIGSVHAITEDGHVLVASRTGSQLAAYTYGATHVIWVAGAQKIVKNTTEGMKRIYEHSLPLESERAHNAYGVPGSFVNKLLIYNREDGERLILVLVKEKLGF